MNRVEPTYRSTVSNASISGTFVGFAFAGKEKDSETGLSYFGARYYDADLTTGWLSVDPMANKYPSMSPYSYCAGNPVKLVDPDGMDVWELDNSGKIVSHKTDKSYDQVKILGAAGDIICSSDKYEYGSITELNLDGTENTTFRVRGLPEAENLFEFLADCYTDDNGMPLEWSHATISNTNMSDNIVGTTQKERSNGIFNLLHRNGYSIEIYVHNHPSGDPSPSLFLLDEHDHGDYEVAKNHPTTIFYAYTPLTGYSRYDGNYFYDERVLNLKSGPQQPASFYNWLSIGWQPKR